MEARTAGEERPRWAEIAYEAIAPFYDDFTAHHDYELWLGNLLPELERLGLQGNRLLDVACGTGKSFIPMLSRGWEVTASDISAAMVELARAKVGDAVDLSVADMRDLPDFGEFDLVWCLDDAVNYLLSGEELEQALRRDAAQPRPRRAADVRRQHAQRLPHLLRRRSGGRARRPAAGLEGPLDARTRAPGSISEASFEVLPLEGEDGPRIPPEMHRQRHFPEAEVLASAGGAGLECLEVFGHGEDAVLQAALRGRGPPQGRLHRPGLGP